MGIYNRVRELAMSIDDSSKLIEELNDIRDKEGLIVKVNMMLSPDINKSVLLSKGLSDIVIDDIIEECKNDIVEDRNKINRMINDVLKGEES